MGIVINGRERTVGRIALGAPEAAFVLQCSEIDIRNMWRRGHRLQVQGVPDEVILRRGALPVLWLGRLRRVRPLQLAAHPAAQSDPLALEALAALVEGRLEAPRATDPQLAAPKLVDWSSTFLRSSYRQMRPYQGAKQAITAHGGAP